MNNTIKGPIQNIIPHSKSDILDKVELYATRLIANKLPDKMVYHNIEQTHRFVEYVEEILSESALTPIDQEITMIMAWFKNTGFKYDYQKGLEHSKKIAIDFLKSIKYPENNLHKFITFFEQVYPFQATEKKIDHPIAKVLSDAQIIDFCEPKKGKKRLKKAYLELQLYRDFSLSQKGWFKSILEILLRQEFYTAHAKEKYTPLFDDLIDTLQKEQRALNRKYDRVLQKELSTTSEELKELKKNLSAMVGRNERGIQTLLKITSKNHTSLLALVDRKARIMIAVNAIIISIVIGDWIIVQDGFQQSFWPVMVLAIASCASIFYSILAIWPASTHGTFTEDEIRDKKGNILFFGNYHKMHQQDFEWGMLQMMNDSNYLYLSIIRDIYYQGRELQTKYSLIRHSLVVFLIGLFLSVISFFILKAI